MKAGKQSDLKRRNATGEGCSATASFYEIRTRLIPGSFHNNDILSRHLSAWSRAEKLTTSRCFPLYLPALPSLQQTMAAARSLCPLQQQGRELVGHVEHHIMPACKLLLPPAALSCLGVKLVEGTFKATRLNVSDVCDAVAGAADLRRRFKTGQRVHRALTVHPGGVCRIDREERRRSWRNSPAIAMGHSQFPVALTIIGQVVEKGFSVLGNEGVEVDERANPVRHPVGDVARDETAVGMSDHDAVA